MRFIPLDEITSDLNSNQLKTDFKSAHQIGSIGLGENCLYLKKLFKTYYIPYSKITRAYRRVFLVPAQMCCASGKLEVQSIVIESAKGELVNVNLPGERAVQILMEELKEKAPAAEYTCPEKPIEHKPGKSGKSQQAHKSKERKTEV